MKKVLTIIGLCIFLSLAGCQRYQAFLLSEYEESLEQEKSSGETEMQEESGSESSVVSTQYVLVDHHTGRLYYFNRNGELVAE